MCTYGCICSCYNYVNSSPLTSVSLCAVNCSYNITSAITIAVHIKSIQKTIFQKSYFRVHTSNRFVAQIASEYSDELYDYRCHKYLALVDPFEQDISINIIVNVYLWISKHNLQRISYERRGNITFVAMALTHMPAERLPRLLLQNMD